jgi:hypothetical protein
MHRVTLAGDLPGGTSFVAVVTTGHILVEVNGTVTAAMRPRMTRDDAAELSRSLSLLLHSRHEHGETADAADSGRSSDQPGPDSGPDHARG